MTDSDITAALAGIRERAEYAKEYMQGDPMPSSLDDVPRLLAAVEAVLKLADEFEQLKTVPPSGKEDEAAALGLRWCAAKVREAITAALTASEET